MQHSLGKVATNLGLLHFGSMTHVNRLHATWRLLRWLHVLMSAPDGNSASWDFGRGTLPGRAVLVCLPAAVRMCRLDAMPGHLMAKATSPGCLQSYKCGS